MSPDAASPTTVPLGILAGVAGLAFATLTGLAVLYPYQSSYVEGYLLEQAQRLAGGGSLYGPLQEQPWLVDNFPPLYPRVMAAGTVLFGESFVFGRALTMAAVIGLAVMAFRFHRAQDRPIGTAAAWTTLWLVSPFVLRRAMLVRMDFAAILFAALGFFLFLRTMASDRSWSWQRLAAIAGLFLLAGLTRQTMIAAPAAVVMALWIAGQRRPALRLAGLLVAFAAAAVAVLQVASDGGFLRHAVLYNTGRYSLSLMALKWGTLFGWQGAIVVLGGLGAWRLRGDPQRRVLAIWWVLSMLAALTVGKPGSTYNHFLEPLFVSGLLAPAGWKMLLAFPRRAVPPTRASAALAVLLLAQMILSGVSGPVGTGIDAVSQRDEDAELVALLEGVPGPVLSENAGAVVQSGHQLVIEPRTLLELTLSGAWNETAFVASIQDREYSIVVLERFPPSSVRSLGFRFSDAAWSAITDGYVPTQSIGRYEVWRPISEVGT